MRLELVIKNPEVEPSGGVLPRTSFDRRGGSLGRAANCDWRLPDPERHISGCHAKIIFEGGCFQ
ncbi:MAG: FHA domain-containing protein, partial [Pseudomonadota bacterium]